MILRVTKRGAGRSASPTVRLKGERGLGERGPLGAFWGGPLGAVAPPRRSMSKRNGRTLRCPQLCARARDGRWGRGGLMVLGRWGRGGWMVLGRWGRGGWMVEGEGGWFCRGWFGSGWFLF